MHSSAARREEIQKRLQLLKEEREREQAAFEELAAAHPELSASELTEMAQRRAKEGVPTALEVAGATVRVGDYVCTIDDAGVLSLAERGQPVRDPLKRVYLGERGRVVRVLPTFQGKPAIELLFADGAEKIFFAECLDVGEQSTKKRHAAAGKKAAAGAGTEGRPPTASSSSAAKGGHGGGEEAEEEKPALPPVPGWGQLAIPRRESRQSAQCTTLTTPPPPPTAASATASLGRPAGGTTAAPAAVGRPTAPKREPQQRPEPAAPANSPTATATTAAVEAPAATETKKAINRPATPKPSPPAVAQGGKSPLSAAAPAAKTPAVAAPAPAPAPAVAQRYQAIGLVKEALSDPPSRHVSPGAEELGLPSEELFVDSLALAKGTPDLDNLAQTPRPGFLEASVWPAPRVEPVPVELSQVPRRCPVNYEAKFSLDDKSTRIPRYAAPATPVATSAAATAATAPTARPVRSSETVHSAPTAPAAHAAKRVTPVERKRSAFLSLPNATPLKQNTTFLNRTDGFAVEESPAPRHPQLDYSSRSSPGLHVVSKEPPAAVRRAVASRPVNGARPAAHTGGRTALSTRVAGGIATPPPAPPLSQAGGRATAASALRTGVTHIRVYENGVYDNEKYDRVYRTVTIRPSYKTLMAVKVLVTRELEWRDGRRVDLLYDASGAEITSLAALTDGASIVASSGDRFIVPYPNSHLHQEAMRLSGAL